MTRQRIVQDYFQSWISKDPEVIQTFFTDEIEYIECYGPVYRGREQCLRWFSDWNRKGSVFKWDIKSLYQDQNTIIAEWYFECCFEGDTDGFDGVSIIEFDSNNKIASIKEFQSKSAHQMPYGSSS